MNEDSTTGEKLRKDFEAAVKGVAAAAKVKALSDSEEVELLFYIASNAIANRY